MECFEMIKPMVVGFCSIEGCCHCVGVAFESTCTVKGSEMFTGLFLYFKERYIKVCDFIALLAEHGSQFTVLLL